MRGRLGGVDDHDPARAVHGGDQLAKTRCDHPDHVVHRRDHHDGVAPLVAVGDDGAVVAALEHDPRDARAPSRGDRRQEHGVVLRHGRHDPREPALRQARQQQAEAVRRVEREGARVAPRRDAERGERPLSRSLHLGIHAAPGVVFHAPAARTRVQVVVLHRVDHRLRAQGLARRIEVDRIAGEVVEARTLRAVVRLRRRRAARCSPAEETSTGRAIGGIHAAHCDPTGRAPAGRPAVKDQVPVRRERAVRRDCRSRRDAPGRRRRSAGSRRSR